MALTIAHPWASASSCLYSLAALVTTAGDATPLWETSLIRLAAATSRRLPLPISLRSLSPILAAAFIPPRGRPTLALLSLVINK